MEQSGLLKNNNDDHSSDGEVIELELQDDEVNNMVLQCRHRLIRRLHLTN